MYCFNFCVHSTLIAIKLASVQRDSMVPCSQLKLSPRHCPLQKMQIPEPPQRCPTVIATVRNIRYQIPLERVHSATCCCRGRQMADGIQVLVKRTASPADKLISALQATRRYTTIASLVGLRAKLLDITVFILFLLLLSVYQYV